MARGTLSAVAFATSRGQQLVQISVSGSCQLIFPSCPETKVFFPDLGGLGVSWGKILMSIISYVARTS